jgi:hypothetical protein
MNGQNEDDLRVESLSYALDTPPDQSFAEDAAPVTLETGDFEARLAAGTLTVTMKADTASEAEARDLVEPYLKAWELDVDLRYGRPLLRFRFTGSQIVNRAAPAGTHDFRISSAVEMSDALALRVTRAAYPQPPATALVVTPEVEILRDRWDRYARGGDRLLGMAYYCLTLVEIAYGDGNRAVAANALRISRNVLSTLGRITGRAGVTHGRKFSPTDQSLTPEEDAWVKAAVAAIIRRAAEVAAVDDPESLPILNLDDLPRIG